MSIIDFLYKFIQFLMTALFKTVTKKMNYRILINEIMKLDDSREKEKLLQNAFEKKMSEIEAKHAAELQEKSREKDKDYVS